MTKNLLLYINETKWKKTILSGNSVLYVPKYINTSVDYFNLDAWKSLVLPYILVQYDNGEIASIETNAGAIRSTPIFYNTNDKFCLVSDSAETIIMKLGIKELEELSVAEFLSFGYVTSDKTLMKDIKSLQAGETLFADKTRLILRDQYLYNFVNKENKPENDYKKGFKNVSEDVFHDLIISLKGKTAIVPLSGGYDSRFILAMLHLGGVKDVITFSWGILNNDDMRIGKEVAKKLGYEWHPVFYTKKTWESAYKSNSFYNCLNHLHNYTSISWFASVPFMHHIHSSRLINKLGDSVFLLGLGGAVMSSQMPNSTYYLRSIQAIAESLILKYELFEQVSFNAMISDKIIGQLTSYLKYSDDKLSNVFDIWMLREREAKFIANVTRFYEYYNYYYSTPLHDQRFVDFWSRIPYSEKFNKKLYKEYLDEYIFYKLNICFKQKQNNKKYFKSLLKSAAQRFRYYSRLHYYLKSKRLQKYFTSPNVFGFDFALPMLAEKGQNEFIDSFSIVNGYKIKLLSSQSVRKSPYSYLSEFILALAIDNLNKIECKKTEFKNE